MREKGNTERSVRSKDANKVDSPTYLVTKGRGALVKWKNCCGEPIIL